MSFWKDTLLSKSIPQSQSELYIQRFQGVLLFTVAELSKLKVCSGQWTCERWMRCWHGGQSLPAPSYWDHVSPREVLGCLWRVEVQGKDSYRRHQSAGCVKDPTQWVVIGLLVIMVPRCQALPYPLPSSVYGHWTFLFWNHVFLS